MIDFHLRQKFLVLALLPQENVLTHYAAGIFAEEVKHLHYHFEQGNTEYIRFLSGFPYQH